MWPFDTIVRLFDRILFQDAYPFSKIVENVNRRYPLTFDEEAARDIERGERLEKFLVNVRRT